MKLFYSLALPLFFLSLSSAITDRPIIGILALPANRYLSQFGRSYIASSYVKYLESAGARVVPIPYTTPLEEITRLFGQLNGILFTGGGAELNGTFLQVQSHLINLVMNAKDRGDHVPLVGTCLGFEAIANIIAGANVLTRCDAENYSIPLEARPVAISSRMLGSLPPADYTTLTTLPVTLNNHMWCVKTDTFINNPKLSSFFKLLTTNVDRHGLSFVSTMEGVRYPIYATQWHPEKNSFEWHVGTYIDHSPAAVSAMNALARQFVGEARLNDHHFPSTDVEFTRLIYNYAPLFTGKTTEMADFQQAYVFP